MQKLLFIGMVWPEPQSSAAGTRIIQLIKTFLGAGFHISFASAASKSAYSFELSELGVVEQNISLNDSSFDDYIKTLQPEIVVFDRFMSEEQYGWRLRQQCPQAMSILDTEDLHFLRQARQEALKKNKEPDYYSEIARREIAAILRCDLSLIISQEEKKILETKFHINPAILYYLPFLEEPVEEAVVKAWKPFEDRQDFMFIGNFLHEPNWRTVQYLKSQIWPMLSKLLPKAALHIYGAYASAKVYQLHKPQERFLILDRAEDARLTMENYRLLLAPIPFGAGIKGKFVDAMQSGTPNVSSHIGAEDMLQADMWNGLLADDPAQFCASAVKLYTDKALWYTAQNNGISLLHRNYNKSNLEKPFLQALSKLSEEITAHRNNNFMGQILNSQVHNSLKYMSLWIEEKNKNKGPQ